MANGEATLQISIRKLQLIPWVPCVLLQLTVNICSVGKVSDSHNNSLVPRACQWNLSVIIFVPLPTTTLRKRKIPTVLYIILRLAIIPALCVHFPRGAKTTPKYAFLLFLAHSVSTPPRCFYANNINCRQFG